MPILVTGAAGFIGFHLCQRLLSRGEQVIGFDNLNPYYDPALKQARLERLTAEVGFCFVQGDLADGPAVAGLFERFQPSRVVNLAAQAGVRYSVENPSAYIQSNMVGFGHLLEGCHHGKVSHLVYTSSSSVYGGNTRLPF